MPGTVAAAPTLRGMLLAYLRTDATLLTYLGGTAPAGRIQSATGAPQSLAAPFVLLRFEGEGSFGDDQLNLGTWAIEVHDLPARKTYALDRICARIRWIVDHTDWARPTDDTTKPIRSHWAGATGELTDDGYSTIKRIARLRLYQA